MYDAVAVHGLHLALDLGGGHWRHRIRGHKALPVVGTVEGDGVLGAELLESGIPNLVLSWRPEICPSPSLEVQAISGGRTDGVPLLELFQSGERNKKRIQDYFIAQMYLAAAADEVLVVGLLPVIKRQATGYRLQATSYKLQAISYELHDYNRRG